jgi:hypothetical protein
MTKITQLPQKIDSNVTVVVPKTIEIKYTVNTGWYIEIEGIRVIEENELTKYWNDVTGAMQYLVDKHLIVTKAYTELEKMAKKVEKSKSKKAA